MDVYDLIEAHKNQRKLQQGLLDPASVPYSALGSLHVIAQVLKLNRTMQPPLTASRPIRPVNTQQILLHCSSSWSLSSTFHEPPI